MNFQQVPIPGVPEGAPKAMAKEGVALGAAVDRLAEMRSAVNEAEPFYQAAFREDAAYDRAPYFRQVAECFALECELRDRLCIYLIGRAEFHDRERSAVQDELSQLERRTRADLGLDPAATLPLAALQTQREWHTLRHRLGGLAQSDNSTSFQNDSALLQASEQRIRYHELAAAEPKRLRQLQVKREQDARDREVRLAAAEKVEQPRREREARVQALFKTK
jgi:hypothetical protein